MVTAHVAVIDQISSSETNGNQKMYVDVELWV